MSKESCPKCGKSVWDNRSENDTRAKVGEKLRPDFSCKDKTCGWVQWREKAVVRTDKEEKIFHGSDKLPPMKTEEPKPLPVNKEVDRDASIVAQVCLKVKAESGAYKDNEGLTIPDINEKIYEDYIFFLNRLSK